MRVYGYKLPLMSSLILWIIVWELLGQFNLVQLFPPFTEVIVALGEVVTSSNFLEAIRITLTSYVTGLVLAMVGGVALGFLMGNVVTADRMLNMWVNMFVSAPLSALVPIFMILFGLGMSSVIVAVFMFAVWIIALDTRAGVQHVAPSLIEMAKSFGASRFQRYKIIFWASLPEILSGVRMGVIRGVKGVVIGQLLVSIIGVGRLFTFYQNNFMLDRFWALILILFALALGLADVVGRLEKRVEYYAGART